MDDRPSSLNDASQEPVLRGDEVVLRPAIEADVEALVAIRSTPAVAERWGSHDLEAEVRGGLREPELAVFVVEHDGAVIGSIQWGEDDDPDYAHASIDIYLDPAAHGRGLGTDATRTLVRHLFDEQGHHRITIDPAADNEQAIRCYERVGFKRVGVMRSYERLDGGDWHDGLLMDLLVEEFHGHDHPRS